MAGLSFPSVVATSVAIAMLTGCNRSNHSTNSLTGAALAAIGQRYQAVVDPANAALSAISVRALTYDGGSTANLDSAAHRTAAMAKNASRQLGHIGAPEPLHRNIADVASAMDAVVVDLTTLGAARGEEVQSDIARLVADVGRVSAADNLVRLAVNPSRALVPPPAQPADTVVTFIIPDTITPAPPTTVPRRVATTRPRTATTVARTPSTTRVVTSTTVAGH